MNSSAEKARCRIPEVAGDGGQASANHHAETHFLCQIASSMFPGK